MPNEPSAEMSTLPSFSAVVKADQSLADNTTANVTSTNDGSEPVEDGPVAEKT